MISEGVIFLLLLYIAFIFSEGLQLIAEVEKSWFLLITFISQEAFSHLVVSHLFLLIQ